MSSEVNGQPTDDLVIDARGVSKSYRIYGRPIDRFKQAFLWGQREYYREFWALRDVTFCVARGEAVGIVGRNGSGKSTLLQIIAGTLTPTEGTVAIRGRVAALLELGSGFNPEFTGRENVYMNGAILGMSAHEIDQRYDAIAAFADIGEFLDQPVKTYSSGMMMRLAFAVSAHVDADILIVDEALAVGDAAFQARCFRRIKRLRETGATLLLATHDTATLNQVCARALLLDRGRLALLGPARTVSEEYYRRLQQIERLEPLEAPAAAPETTGAPGVPEEPLERPVSRTASRMGDRSAEIVGYAIWDHTGRRSHVLRARETFRVDLAIRFHQDMENPHAGFALRDVQSRIVLGGHTLFEDVRLGPVQGGQEATLSFELPLLVNAGTYLLMFGVADHATPGAWRDCDVHFDFCEIQVVGEHRAWGIVNAPAAIRVTHRTPPSRAARPDGAVPANAAPR
jgi:ABC-type polysaccharide/polyol phosphate transport system ATPase subunit